MYRRCDRLCRCQLLSGLRVCFDMQDPERARFSGDPTAVRPCSGDANQKTHEAFAARRVSKGLPITPRAGEEDPPTSEKFRSMDFGSHFLAALSEQNWAHCDTTPPSWRGPENQAQTC